MFNTQKNHNIARPTPILLITLVAIITTFLLSSHAFAQREQKSTSDKPVVISAVSPPFVPFILGEVGEFEMSVEVRIAKDGTVVAAKVVKSTLFIDNSAEEAAKQWRFNESESAEVRTAVLRFIYRVVSSEDPKTGLPTIFRPPFEVEVRHLVFKKPIDIDPISLNFGKRESLRPEDCDW